MKFRSGFTLIELLVVIAIISVLVGMTLPAIQSVRGAARRTECLNHLRQIGMSCMNFESARGAFPPARLGPIPGTVQEMLHVPVAYGSWFVRIMPYLEQDAIHDQWNWKAEFDSQVEVVRSSPVATYLCPDRRSLSDAVGATKEVTISAPCGCPAGTRLVTGGALGDYAGNAGDLSPGAIGAATDFYQPGMGTGVLITARTLGSPDSGPTGWSDKITITKIIDGQSNTILAGEAFKSMEELGLSPSDGPIYSGYEFPAIARVGGPGAPIARNRNDTNPTNFFQWGSWHAGICNFVLADGSTHTWSVFIEPETLRRLSCRADGAVIDFNGLE